MTVREKLVDVRDLHTWFPIRSGLLQRVTGHVKAVDGVSFSVERGRTLALVGESGCGKTTVGKSILRLHRPHRGAVAYRQTDLLPLSRRAFRPYRKRMQIVFQDPANSLDPRMRVRDIVAEGLHSFGPADSPTQLEAKVCAALERVGLGIDAMWRYPHEFSGGQRQRICIARALAVEPEFLVCDEATSALDVSVQASILNLLKSLQDELGLTYLFITHDLSVVEYLAHRVAVMYLGQIVEEDRTEDLFRRPRHPYTQSLLASAPTLDPDPPPLSALDGDVPSPTRPPSGCRFHTRCPKRFDRCGREPVPLYNVPGGVCRCLLWEGKETKED
jgi:peptide/nickel transport system ATP-binding protein